MKRSGPSKPQLLIATGLILAAVLPLALFPWVRTSTPAHYIGADDPFSYRGAAGIAGTFLLFCGQAFLIYAAFEISTAWGFAVFLVPFASLVFLARYWRQNKDALLFFGLGGLFFVLRAALHT